MVGGGRQSDDATLAVFERYDTNGTGQLSRPELSKLLADLKYDADEDYVSGLLRSFSEFDDNKDGLISPAEFMPLFEYLGGHERLEAATPRSADDEIKRHVSKLGKGKGESGASNRVLYATFREEGPLGLQFLQNDDDQLEVLRVHPGSQAERVAGLRAGLLLESIAGTSTSSMDLPEAAELIQDKARRPLVLKFIMPAPAEQISQASSQTTLSGTTQNPDSVEIEDRHSMLALSPAASNVIIDSETLAVFERYDTNGTGQLSLPELSKLLADLQYDADEDYVSGLLRSFSEFDDNKDGLISPAEFMPLFEYLGGHERLEAATPRSTINMKGEVQTQAAVTLKQNISNSKFTTTFREFDHGNKGNLDARDVEYLLQKLGFAADADYVLDLLDIFGTFDGNEKSVITLNNFEAVWEHLGGDKALEFATARNKGVNINYSLPPTVTGSIDSETLAVFERYDTNGTGQLSRPELSKLLADLQYDADEDYVSGLLRSFSEFDDNKDGLISPAEFMPLFEYLGGHERLEAAKAQTSAASYIQAMYRDRMQRKESSATRQMSESRDDAAADSGTAAELDYDSDMSSDDEVPPPIPGPRRAMDNGVSSEPSQSQRTTLGTVYTVMLMRSAEDGGFGLGISQVGPEQAETRFGWAGAMAVPAVVDKIIPGGPAASAGVRVGDSLLAVAGCVVDGRGSAGLRAALIHLAAYEKRRKEADKAEEAIEWVFRSPPFNKNRTESSVYFSPSLTHVRTFELSPTEEASKLRHWQTVNPTGPVAQQAAVRIQSVFRGYLERLILSNVWDEEADATQQQVQVLKQQLDRQKNIETSMVAISADILDSPPSSGWQIGLESAVRGSRMPELSDDNQAATVIQATYRAWRDRQQLYRQLEAEMKAVQQELDQQRQIRADQRQLRLEHRHRKQQQSIQSSSPCSFPNVQRRPSPMKLSEKAKAAKEARQELARIRNEHPQMMTEYNAVVKLQSAARGFLCRSTAKHTCPRTPDTVNYNQRWAAQSGQEGIESPEKEIGQDKNGRDSLDKMDTNVTDMGGLSDNAEAARNRLTKIYIEHQPAKLRAVPKLLQKWAGREAELIERVEAKYLSDSKLSMSAETTSMEKTAKVVLKRQSRRLLKSAHKLHQSKPALQSQDAVPPITPLGVPPPITPEVFSQLGDPPPLLSLPWEASPSSTPRPSINSQSSPAEIDQATASIGLLKGLESVKAAEPNPVASLRCHQDKFESLVYKGLVALCDKLANTPIWKSTYGVKRKVGSISAAQRQAQVKYDKRRQRFVKEGAKYLNSQWLRQGSQLSSNKAQSLVKDAATWMASHLETELRKVISSPFEVFLTHAARRIQDRTGALEAAVPERDLQDLKGVHDNFQAVVRSAVGIVLPEIAADAASIGTALRASGRAATREQFVSNLQSAMLLIFNTNQILAWLRGALGQPTA